MPFGIPNPEARITNVCSFAGTDFDFFDVRSVDDVGAHRERARRPALTIFSAQRSLVSLRGPQDCIYDAL